MTKEHCSIINAVCPYEGRFCSNCRLYGEYEKAKKKSEELIEKVMRTAKEVDESVWDVPQNEGCYNGQTCAHFAQGLKGKGISALRAITRESRGKKCGR